MPYASLRDFIARLEQSGRLVHVKAPVSPYLEMTEIQTRLLAEKGLDDRGRIGRAYRLALGRPPTAAEERRALKFLGKPAGADQMTENWAMIYHALFASLDFRYVD